MNRATTVVLLSLLLAAQLLWSSGTALAQVDSVLLCEDNPDQTYLAVTITRNDQFAIATGEKGMTVWNLESGKEVYALDKAIEDMLYDEGGNRLLFTESGRNVLAELRMNASPETWTIGTVLDVFEDYEPLAISREGRYMAVKISHDGFGVVDLTKKTLMFQHTLENVEHATFSPRGTRVAVGLDRYEDAVVTYSMPEGERVKGTASFLSSARRLAYSPDGESLAVACRMGGTGSIVLLEPETLRPVRGAKFPLKTSPEYCAISWSGDGNYFSGAQSSDAIGVYAVKNNEQLVSLRGYSIDSLVMNANGSRVASVARTAPGVVLWDWQADLRFRSASKTVASHPRLDGESDSSDVDLRLQFSPDGKSLALAVPAPSCCGMRKPLQATDEPGVRPMFDFSQFDVETAYIVVIEMASGGTAKVMSSNAPEFKKKGYVVFGQSFTSLEFSPDGKTLATLFCDFGPPGHLILWDVARARPRVQMLIKREDNTWREGWIDLKYVDGSSLLLLPANHDDLGVQLFDLGTSSVRTTVRGDFGSSLLLLPNGCFASGFATWDYLNREPLYRENSDNADDYHPLARTAGETIVGVRRGEHLGRWDLDTLKVSYPYAAHRDNGAVQIHSLASSPNGQLVATGCADHLIRVWESATGRLLVNLRGHRRAVDALCFSPDGNTLVSASRDGTTRFWDVRDLGKGKATLERPELPTRRAFRTAGGATVTVVFDRPATKEEIVSALQDAQSQLDE